MIAAWMLYSAAVGVLIGGAALAGDRFCRLLRVPVRWVWLAGMCASLLLACVGLMRVTKDAASVPGGESAGAFLVDTSQPASSDGYITRVTAAVVGAARDVRLATAATAERAYHIAAASGVAGRGLAVAWAAGSAALLLILCGTLFRLRRVRAGWRSHRIGDVHVLISPDAGPALIGLVRPSIVIPAWLLAEPAERQRLVVEHEDEHRRAGDHALLAGVCIIVCVMPWNIALWWMLLRTRLAVELDCDARVLRRGVPPRSYGSLLLEIAGRTRARAFAAPALADSRTHLERRLMAMTENNRTPRRARASATALVALLLGAAACSTDLPTAAAIDNMDVADAQMKAEQAGLLVPLAEDEAPLIVVDGVIVTEQLARDLKPEEIERIEVLKARAAASAYGSRGEHGVILVKTRRTAAPVKPGVLGVPIDEEERNVMTGRALRERELVELRASAAGAARSGSDPLIIVDGVPVRADEPLIVIDGVITPATSPLRSSTRLSPDMIERIEIVKGAAAARLYDHPRAVNGVIIITTKTGGR